MNEVNSVAQMVSRLEAAVIALRRRRPSQARGVGPKGDRRICLVFGVERMCVFVLLIRKIEPEEAFCDQDDWSPNGCSCFVNSVSFC